MVLLKLESAYLVHMPLLHLLTVSTLQKVLMFLSQNLVQPFLALQLTSIRISQVSPLVRLLLQDLTRNPTPLLLLALQVTSASVMVLRLLVMILLTISLPLVRLHANRSLLAMSREPTLQLILALLVTLVFTVFPLLVSLVPISLFLVSLSVTPVLLPLTLLLPLHASSVKPAMNVLVTVRSLSVQLVLTLLQAPLLVLSVTV